MFRALRFLDTSIIISNQKSVMIPIWNTKLNRIEHFNEDLEGEKKKNPRY